MSSKLPRLTGEEYLSVTQIQVSTETLGLKPYYCNSTIKGRFKLQRILSVQALDRKKTVGKCVLKYCMKKMTVLSVKVKSELNPGFNEEKSLIVHDATSN